MNTLLIITIANNEKVYADFYTNLSDQKGIDFKLNAVFNYNNEFKSAISAYNSVLNNIDSISDYKYVLFIHPDIRFLDEFSLRDIILSADLSFDFGVMGIAGAPEIFSIKPVIYSSIIQGCKKERVGYSVMVPTAVQTLDECFFLTSGMNLRNLPLEEIKNSESVNNRWHLYCVNYCLNMIKSGKTNYVLQVEFGICLMEEVVVGLTI